MNPTRMATPVDRFDALDARAQPPPAHRADGSRTVGGSSAKDPAGLGRSVLVAVTATVTVALVAITGGLLATGSSVAEASGIGVFGALWGGGGFGAMIGGVWYAARLERATPVPSPVGTADDLSPALLPAWPSSTRVPGAR